MLVPSSRTRTEISISTPGPSCSKGRLLYAIQWIYLYPGDNANGFSNTYPLASDLSDGWCIPTFEQSGPVLYGALVRPLFCAEYFTDDDVILYLMNKMWGNIIKVMCYYLSGLTRRRAN